MSLFRFPGAYVWECTLPNHEDIKARILPKIIEEAEEHVEDEDYKWSPEVSTSVITNFGGGRFDPLRLFTKEDIASIALKPTRELMDQAGIGTFAKDYDLRAFWWNRYGKGSTAPPHVHAAGISGVYLLEQTERCPLEFQTLNPYTPNPDHPAVNYRPEAEEGTVLLFPGSLLHWVYPTVGPRTTVSFNLGCVP